MATFNKMLDDFLEVEARGFDPFTETYSGKMKELRNRGVEIGSTMSDLSPNQRQAMRGIVDESGRDVGGFSSAFRQAESGNYILNQERTRRLMDYVETKKKTPPGISDRAFNSITKEGDRYVSSFTPHDELPEGYYDRLNAAYNPMSGKIASPSKSEFSDFLIKEAVSRGDAQIKNILLETPEEDFEKYGVTKSSLLKEYGIE